MKSKKWKLPQIKLIICTRKNLQNANRSWNSHWNGIKFMHLTVLQCVHYMSNTQRNKQTHTERFFIFAYWVCVCVSSVQGFSLHYDTSETERDRQTDRERQSERQIGRDRQRIPKWTTAKLQSYVLCTSLPHKLCPNVVRVCESMCVRVCVWVCLWVCLILLKCEWRLDVVSS